MTKAQHDSAVKSSHDATKCIPDNAAADKLLDSTAWSMLLRINFFTVYFIVACEMCEMYLNNTAWIYQHLSARHGGQGSEFCCLRRECTNKTNSEEEQDVGYFFAQDRTCGTVGHPASHLAHVVSH